MATERSLKRNLRERADRLGHQLEPRFHQITYLGLPTTTHEILCDHCGVIFTIDTGGGGTLDISSARCPGPA